MAMIKCRECNSDISSEAKTCPHCGCSCKEKKPIPKKLIVIGSFVLAIIVITVAIVSSTSAWKRTFDVVYIDYEMNNYISSCYVYEITNKSDRTVQNVYAIVEVETLLDGKFKFEDRLWDIKPGEVEEYKLSTTTIKSEAKDHGVDTDMDFWLTNVDIVGFKWE